MDKFKSVDLTGFLDTKSSVVVTFCPKTDRIDVDLFQLSVGEFLLRKLEQSNGGMHIFYCKDSP